VEVVSTVSGRPPEVDRPEGSPAVCLTFRGTRDAKVRDRDTRIRIALHGALAAHLWRARRAADGPGESSSSAVTASATSTMFDRLHRQVFRRLDVQHGRPKAGRPRI
jgi:hypothetical protein